MKTVLFEDLVKQKIDNRGKTPPVVDEGYPLIEVNAITKKSIYPEPSKARKFVDKAVWDRWFRQHLEENDILFTTVGTIGESAIVPKDPGYAVAQNILGFRFDTKQINPMYALYLIRSGWFLDQIKGRAIETVQKSIKWADIRGIEISLPDIEVQREVSSFARALDEKIELNRQMNETLEKIGQALFKHYFIDNPEAKTWKYGKIGEYCKVLLGGTPSRANSEYWVDGSIGWVNSGKVNEFRITNASEMITEKALKESAAKLLPVGTTVLAITGATLGQVSRLEKSFAANQSVIGVLGGERITNEFIYFWIKQNIERIIGHQTGGAQQHINRGNVVNFDLLVAPKELHNEFQKRIEPIMTNITINCFETENLITIRDLLLPRLIPGKIKV